MNQNKGEIKLDLSSHMDPSNCNDSPTSCHCSPATMIRVQNMCCGTEANLIKKCLQPISGVESVAVNVIGRVVYVRHDPEITSPNELVNCLNKVNMGATLIENTADADNKEEKLPRMLLFTIIYVVVQGLLLLAAVIGLFSEEDWTQWVAIAVIVIGIFPILKNSFYAVKKLRIDINILMLIAIIGTLALGEWVEGATVVFLFNLSEGLQKICMYRVQRTISNLIVKRPNKAVLVKTGESVFIENVPIGTSIAIRPGETIPLDGVVTKGRAVVDESSLTGEPQTVEKVLNCKVFSGTVNRNGYLEVETTSDSSSSTVCKVAQWVQEAQSSTTETEAIINKFSKIYTPLVIIVAALLIIIPAILAAADVGTYKKDLKEWGQKSLVVLVISCPCALIMSTPIAVICSITIAARNGTLVKGGQFLETLSKLEVLAFDKTGTLTEGKFKVTDMECVSGQNERDALRLAAGLETKTIHPISAAIISEYARCMSDDSSKAVLPEVTQFATYDYEGQGISGFIEGKQVHVGNKAMLDHCGASLNDNMSSKYQQWSNDSKTVVFVCVDKKVALMIALSDDIRPNTKATLDWLKKKGIQTSMITGDHRQTAEELNAKLHFDEYLSEMKPDHKAEWITSKQQSNVHEKNIKARLLCRKDHVVVGMVGDGVNDGPALVAANVGIAIGVNENTAAEEAADVGLVSNNLVKIAELISLARFCSRLIKQNIAAALFMKAVIAIVAFAGYITLPIAVAVDVLSLLVVILNGLRALSWKAPEIV